MVEIAGVLGKRIVVVKENGAVGRGGIQRLCVDKTMTLNLMAGAEWPITM